MHDWSRVALTGRYRPDGSDIEYEKALRSLKLPVLAACRTWEFKNPTCFRAAKKIGIFGSIFDISSLFHGISCPYPIFGRRTAMRLTFQARQTRFHSPVTLRSPRIENCLKPITDLMMPKTGSTVCLRLA